MFSLSMLAVLHVHTVGIPVFTAFGQLVIYLLGSGEPFRIMAYSSNAFFDVLNGTLSFIHNSFEFLGFGIPCSRFDTLEFYRRLFNPAFAHVAIAHYLKVHGFISVLCMADTQNQGGQKCKQCCFHEANLDFISESGVIETSQYRPVQYSTVKISAKGIITG